MRIDFQTEPSQYRHWKIRVEGPRAELVRDVDEAGDLRARLAKYHDHVEAAFRGWNDAWLDPGFESWDLTAFLPGISLPLLLLQGVEDPYGTPRQIETAAARVSGPVESHLLPGCRHAPHLEKPEETLAAIQGFLTGRI